ATAGTAEAPNAAANRNAESDLRIIEAASSSRQQNKGKKETRCGRGGPPGKPARCGANWLVDPATALCEVNVSVRFKKPDNLSGRRLGRSKHPFGMKALKKLNRGKLLA